MIRTLLIAVCCCCSAFAQQSVVLLDPARGGSDGGARIADRLPEKQVTLDLAGRLASLLRARGFTVAMTREADVDVSNDARATLANNAQPVACLLLHATAAGSGVHLYTSALRPPTTPGSAAILWDEAQATYIDRSRALADDLKTALQQSRIVTTTGRTWMRPLDNMQCPAVAVEMAPQKDGTGAEDRTYQVEVANALANTLLLWRGKAQRLAPAVAVPAPAAQPAAAAQPPKASTQLPNGAAVTNSAAPVPKTGMPQTTPQKPRPAAPSTTAPSTAQPLPATPDRTEP